MVNSDNPTSPPIAPSSSVVAWYCRSWKILLGALVGVLISNILCLPLWTDYDVVGFIRTPFNTEARMEILYNGALTGADAFAITSSEQSLSTSTNYSYVDGGQLYIADFSIEGEWKPYSLTLKARKKGRIRIRLGGPLEKDDYGEIYSIPVDYRNLRIRGKEIFPDRKKVTHTKCFTHWIPVNTNDTIQISFDVRRHHLDADDFNLIKTKNFWYIVTLSIFAFTVSYILLQRICALWKMGKTEDCCFLFVFFSLLAVPLCNISDAQNAPREGRVLTLRPSVSLVLKEGSDYGKRYDKWFSDHLGGRQQFIKMHDVIQRETQKIIRGRDGWSCYVQDSGWLFDDLKWQLSSKDLGPIVKALVELGKFCEGNHIKLYVLVVPRKQNFYQDQLHGYGFNRRQSAAENAIHAEIKRLVAKHHVTYIFPWVELRDACKQDYTYFKLTHHWTDWGAYIGYRALMKAIRQDFPNIPTASLGDYNQTQCNLIRDDWNRRYSTGHLGKFFNFETDHRCPSPPYNYYDHKNADKLVLNTGKFTKDFRYGGGAYKIMVIGTSQTDNLMNFLPYSASHTKYIRINLGQVPESETWKIMKHYKKDILSYKPDVLIFSIYGNSTNMPSIQNIFKQ